MKEYAFIVMEDVCAANCKDTEATELLQKMRLYGEVKPLETVVASVRKEYQAVIDNLTAQIKAIADQELNDDEILWLNFIRERKAANGKVYQNKIDSLEGLLEEMRVSSLKRAEQIQLLAEQLKNVTA